MTNKTDKKPADPTDELMDRIRRLELRADEAEKTSGQMSKRQATADGRAMKARQRIDQLYEMLDPRTLEKAQADAKSIHDLYRLTFLKHCVATETAFLARAGDRDIMLAEKLALAAVRAFDLPDAWWLEKQSYTLDVWQKILLDIATNGLPDVNPEDYDDAPDAVEKDE